jgi:hypothetical protein
MDLDHLIRSELSAQAEHAPDAGTVLAGARERHRVRRRNRLVAAVSAAAAVLAIAVPYATLGRPGTPDTAGTRTPAPTPAPTALTSYQGHPIPSDAEIAARCLPGHPGAEVVTVFADQYGWSAYVADRTARVYNEYCPYTWSGKTAFPPTIQNAPPVTGGYLPAGQLVKTDGDASSFTDIDVIRDGVNPGAHPTGYAWLVVADGRVSPEVRRLVLHWSTYSADVPIYGPYWMGRVVIPLATPTGNPDQSARLRIEAFGADGHRLGIYLPVALAPDGSGRNLPEVLTRDD